MTTLELDNVSVAFGGVHAVDSLSVGFEQGKVTALIGPNGAGKTTLFNVICGLIRPDSGTICLDGQSLVGKSPWRLARLGIGRLFQDVRVFSRLSVRDNVMTAFPNQAGEGAISALFMPWRGRRSDTKLSGRVDELLTFVTLQDRADALAESLSFGQQKLLAIARLLAVDASVLLLDEPTAGVSPALIPSLLEVLRGLARDHKRTVIVIEHNLNVVLDVADWVNFMDDGQITAFGLPHEVLENPAVRAAYAGLDTDHALLSRSKPSSESTTAS